ncbi:MAG TPA: glutamate formimidoyltransferase [Gemmatimonadales bacterium]|nr:glutamate formimidoyltransferase [Gemmatimonadales bacterium]
MALVECIANLSEGRDAAALERFGDAIRSVPGASLLDVHADPDHHRSVFTFVGKRPAVEESAYRLILLAAAIIDLTRHRGVHPRMGAADVVPFVGLGGVPRGELVALARRLAVRVGREASLPSYLYGDAATCPERRLLRVVRSGQFERLRVAARLDPARRPDAGPPELHPTAGAVAIGVRGPLVAWNVWLAGNDVAAARAIAARVRESGGGLPGVQAMGVPLATRGVAQVSMNLTRPFECGPVEATERVMALAAEAGVEVGRSELVGLVPADLLDAEAAERVRLPDYGEHLLLEPAVERATGLILPAGALRPA